MPRFHDTCAGPIGDLFLSPAVWDVRQREKICRPLSSSWTQLTGLNSLTGGARDGGSAPPGTGACITD